MTQIIIPELEYKKQLNEQFLAGKRNLAEMVCEITKMIESNRQTVAACLADKIDREIGSQLVIAFHLEKYLP